MHCSGTDEVLRTASPDTFTDTQSEFELTPGTSSYFFVPRISRGASLSSESDDDTATVDDLASPRVSVLPLDRVELMSAAASGEPTTPVGMRVPQTHLPSPRKQPAEMGQALGNAESKSMSLMTRRSRETGGGRCDASVTLRRAGSSPVGSPPQEQSRRTRSLLASLSSLSSLSSLPGTQSCAPLLMRSGVRDTAERVRKRSLSPPNSPRSSRTSPASRRGTDRETTPRSVGSHADVSPPMTPPTTRIEGRGDGVAVPHGHVCATGPRASPSARNVSPFFRRELVPGVEEEMEALSDDAPELFGKLERVLSNAKVDVSHLLLRKAGSLCAAPCSAPVSRTPSGSSDDCGMIGLGFREMDRAKKAQCVENCALYIVERRARRFVALFDELFDVQNVHIESVPVWHHCKKPLALVVMCPVDVLGAWAAEVPAIMRLKEMFPNTMEDLVNQALTMDFLGELPVGATIFLRLSPDLHVVFVSLTAMASCDDPENYYTAVRSALLCVRKHNNLVARGQPSAYMSSRVTDANVALQNIVFAHMPQLQCADATVAKAFSLAYQSIARPVRHSVTMRGGEVQMAGRDRLEALAKCREDSGEDNLRARLAMLLEHNVLPMRGLANIDEATILCEWFHDNDEIVRIAALKAFGALLTVTDSKFALPFALTQAQLCGVLAMSPACFEAILTAALNGTVDLFNIVSMDEVNFETRIGHGGSAEVWFGSYRGEEVAIKRYFPSDNRVEFCREACIMRYAQGMCWNAEAYQAPCSTVRHPNLIRLLGCSSHSKMEPFLVMERAEGGSLRAMLYSKTEISMRRMLLFAIQTTRAVMHLHSLNLVHRDLKSDNVLVCGDFVAKLSDYGTTRLSSGSPITGNIGTPHWMAPEVFENLPYSTPSDIYSLGMLFFEIFTRRMPFEDIAPFAIATTVVKGKRPAMPATVPRAIQKLIEPMWSAKPARRPSAGKVLKLLENLLQVERKGEL